MNDFSTLTLGGILEKGAAEVPYKTAVVDGPTRTTYSELNRMADGLAASLSKLGVSKGDRVAIYMKNSLEFECAFFALEKLGIIVVWINALYRRSESEFVLRNSGAKGVIIFKEWNGYDYLEALTAMRNDLPDLQTIIAVDAPQENGVHDFYGLIEEGGEVKLTPPSIDTRKDLAMLIYTSGTTGKPKGAMITHYQAVRAGWEYSLGTGAGADDIFIGFLPMSHSYGCGSILIEPILLQSTVVLMDSFDTEKAFALIEAEQVTLQLGAPVHYLLELDHPNIDNYNLKSLRAGLIAGQPAPEGLITRVEKEMGIHLTAFWGASEVGPGLGFMCSFPSPLDIREQYIGKPVEGTRARVVDPVTRKEVPTGQTGELALSGWHVMRGYWENPEETRKQIEDGWLHMGDLVSASQDGYFKIYGRIKDLINRGGYKIYPLELESLIIEHPKVAQACIVATPNPVLGENICACVIPVPGQDLTLAELRDFLSGKVAPHKLPNELSLMQEFPHLAGGVKVKKFGEGGLTQLATEDTGRQGLRRD